VLRLPDLLLATLAPIVVAGVGIWLIMRFEPAPGQAARNAGAVINGTRLTIPTSDWIDIRMAERPPSVVVLGNSLAWTDVDADVLGRGLGVGSRVAVFSVPQSISTHWYAIAKNRIVGPGYRPRLLLVVAPLQPMLETVPVSDAARANLEAQLDEVEPLIRTRISGRAAAGWTDRLWDRSGQLRSLAVRRVTGDAVARVAGQDRTTDWGSERLDAANKRLFDGSKLDFSLFGWGPPVVAPRPAGQVDANNLPAPEGSFLLDLADLASQAGTQLVVVRAPLSPMLRAQDADPAPEGTTLRLQALLEERGAAFVDYSKLELPPDAYRDLLHMHESGAARFSRVLGWRLRRFRAVDTDRLWRPVQLARPMVRVDGEAWDPATMPLPTGSSLAVDVSTAWPGPAEAAQLTVALHGDPRVTTAAALTLEGEPVEFAGISTAGIARFRAPLPQKTGWSLRVQAEQPVVLGALSVGTDEATTFLIGDEDAVLGPGLRVTDVHWSKPTRALSLRIEGPHARFTLPGLDRLHDRRVGSGAGAPCSPVEAFEFRRPVPVTTGCRELLAEGRGAACFDGSRLLIQGGAADPNRYRVSWSSEPICPDGAMWLPPGATLQGEVTELGALAQAHRLELSGWGVAALDVEVRSQSELVLDDTTLAHARHITFSRPLRRPVSSATISVRNRSQSDPVLIDRLELR
jgi:hypothetical protein